MRSSCFLATGICLLAVATAQDGAGTIARFLLDGEPATIGRDDLALELAMRFGRTEKGRAATQHLIDLELVRTAAREQDLWPKPELTLERFAAIERQLAAQKIALPTFLKQRGMTREEFLEYMATSLAHERLVQRALGNEQAIPTPEMLQLWLKEARERNKVVDDPARLSPGIVARIGPRDLATLDLGRVLLRTATPEERERYTKQIAICRILEARARKAGIAATPEELAAEVEVRRRLTESGQGGKVTFEQMLASQGTTPEQLRNSPVLRAQLLQKKLVARDNPDTVLRTRLAADRPMLDKRHGARRRLAVILVRASETPNALIKRDFAQARQHALEVRAQIDKGKPFEMAAAVNTEDPATKTRGGECGWHHAIEAGFPAEVLAEAFALAKDQISDPIQTKDGIVLVKVLDIEPEPGEAVLLERMRAVLEDEYREATLAAARLEFLST